MAATNKQLLMRIISSHVLKIEKAKYALPESFSLFNFRYLDFTAMPQLSEQERHIYNILIFCPTGNSFSTMMPFTFQLVV